jgi:hypothetical protein
MAESPRPADLYLREVATRLVGPRRTRKRLLAEIAGHLDDAIEANLSTGMQAIEAERHAVEQFGLASAFAEAWEVRCERLRARQRRHIAMLVGTVAVASVLGVVQHADGRRDPAVPSHQCVRASSARVGGKSADLTHAAPCTGS